MDKSPKTEQEKSGGSDPSRATKVWMGVIVGIIIFGIVSLLVIA